LKDTLNPDWEKEILIDYYFEETQKFRIEIYDKDDSSSKLKHHDFLGKCEGIIAELVSAMHGKKVLTLTDIKRKDIYAKGKKSTCTITAEKQAGSSNEIYHFQFCAKKLDDKESISNKSD